MATEKTPVSTHQRSDSSAPSSRASNSDDSLRSAHETRLRHEDGEDRVSHCSEQDHDHEGSRDIEKNLPSLDQTPTNQSRNNNLSILDTVRSHVSHQDMHVSDNVYREQNAEQYLRFSPARKVAIVAILSACSFLSPISSTTILPAMPEVANTFDTTGSVINASNAVFILTMGLSSTFWGTFSQIYGRRPVSFFCQVLFQHRTDLIKDVFLEFVLLLRFQSGNSAFTESGCILHLPSPYGFSRNILPCCG